MDIEFEDDAALSGAFLKVRRGKSLTFDDMKELKANLEVLSDGTLEPRYLKMEKRPFVIRLGCSGSRCGSS
jgi:hypothetical protein